MQKTKFIHSQLMVTRSVRTTSQINLMLEHISYRIRPNWSMDSRGLKYLIGTACLGKDFIAFTIKCFNDIRVRPRNFKRTKKEKRVEKIPCNTRRYISHCSYSAFSFSPGMECRQGCICRRADCNTAGGGRSHLY